MILPYISDLSESIRWTLSPLSIGVSFCPSRLWKMSWFTPRTQSQCPKRRELSTASPGLNAPRHMELYPEYPRNYIGQTGWSLGHAPVITSPGLQEWRHCCLCYCREWVWSWSSGAPIQGNSNWPPPPHPDPPPVRVLAYATSSSHSQQRTRLSVRLLQPWLTDSYFCLSSHSPPPPPPPPPPPTPFI